MIRILIDLTGQFTEAALGTILFSFMAKVPRKHYGKCGLIGGAGWITYWIMREQMQMGNMTAKSIAAALVVCLSRLYGKRPGSSVGCFLFSGIFPLIPYGSVYWSLYSVITGDLGTGLQYGRQILAETTSIVLGIILILKIPQVQIAKLAKKCKKTD